MTDAALAVADGADDAAVVDGKVVPCLMVALQIDSRTTVPVAAAATVAVAAGAAVEGDV